MLNGRKTLTAALITGMAFAAGTATAQQQRPPRPDFSAKAAKMNVPEDALMTCLGKPKEGERPARPDPSKISSCLTKSGYKVSKDTVDEALKAGGPPPRK
ncbi:hypothetical protein [Rhodalgimonas zhirmunskyi]|uniref:Uncharacterized protein n=1 Tax=Rhodalgimonas zhirmunskyi TaxID=2964767 RepID=A0AAJ1UB25_9RHOB|nr:hypothetical protein [Rhodoalgimonas zhirmunskyi]MDQ2094543.1 hypothetical protein [Rhodoalgimonas zhirmunskyi]